MFPSSHMGSAADRMVFQRQVPGSSQPPGSTTNQPDVVDSQSPLHQLSPLVVAGQLAAAPPNTFSADAGALPAHSARAAADVLQHIAAGRPDRYITSSDVLAMANNIDGFHPRYVQDAARILLLHSEAVHAAYLQGRFTQAGPQGSRDFPSRFRSSDFSRMRPYLDDAFKADIGRDWQAGSRPGPGFSSALGGLADELRSQGRRSISFERLLSMALRARHPGRIILRHLPIISDLFRRGVGAYMQVLTRDLMEAARRHEADDARRGTWSAAVFADPVGPAGGMRARTAPIFNRQMWQPMSDGLDLAGDDGSTTSDNGTNEATRQEQLNRRRILEQQIEQQYARQRVIDDLLVRNQGEHDDIGRAGQTTQEAIRVQQNQNDELRTQQDEDFLVQQANLAQEQVRQQQLDRELQR